MGMSFIVRIKTTFIVRCLELRHRTLVTQFKKSDSVYVKKRPKVI